MEKWQTADKTVLVVEDDRKQAAQIKKVLKKNHYDVLVAHDGLDAVEQTNRHQINLILMDVRLPFFSGFWFCNVFKQKKNTKNIPVVIVSEHLNKNNTQKARLVGASDTVKRPFTNRRLLSVVQKNTL